MARRDFGRLAPRPSGLRQSSFRRVEGPLAPAFESEGEALRLKHAGESTFGRAISAGGEELSGLGSGLKSAIQGGILEDEEAALQSAKEAEAAFQRSQIIDPSPRSLKDIKTAEDALKFGVGAVGRGVVSTVPAIATGGVGGIVASTIGKKIAKTAVQKLTERAVQRAVARGISREVAEKNVKKFGAKAFTKTIAKTSGKATKAGVTAGAIAGSTAMGAGELQASFAADPTILKELGIVGVSRAALAASPLHGVLDGLPVMRLFDKAGVGRSARVAVKEAFIKRFGKDSMGQFLAEGSTEAAQVVLEKSVAAFIDKERDVFSEENVQEMLDSFAAGGLTGGVLGGGASTIGRVRERMATMKIPDSVRARMAKAIDNAERTQAEEEITTARERAALTPEPEEEIEDVEAALAQEGVRETEGPQVDINPVEIGGKSFSREELDPVIDVPKGPDGAPIEKPIALFSEAGLNAVLKHMETAGRETTARDNYIEVEADEAHPRFGKTRGKQRLPIPELVDLGFEILARRGEFGNLVRNSPANLYKALNAAIGELQGSGMYKNIPDIGKLTTAQKKRMVLRYRKKRDGSRGQPVATVTYGEQAAKRRGTQQDTATELEQILRNYGYTATSDDDILLVAEDLQAGLAEPVQDFIDPALAEMFPTEAHMSEQDKNRVGQLMRELVKGIEQKQLEAGKPTEDTRVPARAIEAEEPPKRTVSAAKPVAKKEVTPKHQAQIKKILKAKEATEEQKANARAEERAAKITSKKAQREVKAGLRREILAMLERVLGKGIKVQWSDAVKLADGTKVNAKYDVDTNVIELSLRLYNPMSVAFHEAMHSAFHQLLRTTELRSLTKAFNSHYVTKQLKEKYANQPAILKAMEGNSAEAMEERMAYGYQLWLSGQLSLGPKTKGIFQKILKVLSETFGLIRNSTNADRILTALTSGEIEESKRLGKPIDYVGGPDNRLRRAIQIGLAVKDKVKIPLSGVIFTASGSMENTHIPALIEMARAYFIPSGQSAQGDARTVTDSVRIQVAKFGSVTQNLFEGKPKEFGEAVLRAFYFPDETHSAEVLATKQKLDRFFSQFHAYMTKAGLKVGKLKNYFPVVYDYDALLNGQNKFINLLMKHQDKLLQIAVNTKKTELVNGRGKWKDPKTGPKEMAESITAGLIQARGVEVDTEFQLSHAGESVVTKPNFGSVHSRMLGFLVKDPAFAEFRSKELGTILTRYVDQGVKRAEFTRRWGKDGGDLTQLLVDAERQGANDAEMRLARRFIQAMQGTLGIGLDTDPKVAAAQAGLRKAQSWIMLYQNIRLLSLATTTALADPAGIIVRGGDLGTAWTSFKAGIDDAYRKFTGDYGGSPREFAELMGVVDRHTTLESLGLEFGGYYMTDTAKRWNDKFFNIIQLERLTQWTRVMAAASGKHFIEFHSKRLDKPRSVDLLAELGLSPADVRGGIDWTKTKLNVKAHEKLLFALNRFVDQSIMRPTSSLRPIEFSNPHMMLVWHLKSFAFTFHKQILERVYTQAVHHGNPMPFLLLASYLPLMAMGEAMRDLAKGEDDPYKESMDFWQYMSFLARRAGLLGIPQLFIPGGEGYPEYDPSIKGQAVDLLGPTVQHASDFAETMYGEKTAADFLKKSTPTPIKQRLF